MNFEELFNKYEVKPIVNYDNLDLYLIMSKYMNGRIYLGLIEKNGELYADITVNIPSYFLDYGEIFLNGDLEDKLKNKLFNTPVFKKEGSKIKFNYGTYERACYNRKLLKDYMYTEYTIKYWKTEKDRDERNTNWVKKKFNSFEDALQRGRKLFNRNNWFSMEIGDQINNIYFYKENAFEEFYINDLSIVKENKDYLNKYVDDWINKKEMPPNEKLFYCEDGNKYIAVDNTTNNCSIEEFTNEKDVLKCLSCVYEKGKIGGYVIDYQNEYEEDSAVNDESSYTN